MAAAQDIFNDAEPDWEDFRDMEWGGGAVYDILWGIQNRVDMEIDDEIEQNIEDEPNPIYVGGVDLDEW